MNNTQRAKLDAGNRVKAFNKKYETELNAIPEYATERQTFDDAMIIINNSAQVQVGTKGTNSSAVDLAKQNMANVTIKYALRAVVKAKQDNNLVLANKLNHPITYLSKSPKTQAVHQAKEIRDNLNNNLATLTNLSADDITEIDNAIEAYDSIKDTPTIEKQTKAATGTNPLPAAFANAADATGGMYDLVVSYFIDTNRPMVDELALAKQIIITGTRHNGLGGNITKSGLPVFGASIMIVGTDKKTTSDKEGSYNMAKLKIGERNVVVTLSDGNSITKMTSISKAHTETVDFEF